MRLLIPIQPSPTSPMVLIEVIVLAIVQGIAEFLPVSSSGHVVVVAALFKQFGCPMQQMVTVNIVLHVGTLAAIVVFYRRQIRHLVGKDRRVIGLLVAGTLPAAAIAPLIRVFAREALESPLLTGFALLLTGGMLLWATRLNPGKVTCRRLSYRGAVLIGMLQAFAVLPGISRSGATIVAGLACGMKREEAATFSFLLAIPAIGGAGLHELVGLLWGPANGTSPGLLALGAALSFAVGLASLAWLIRWLKKGRLHHFAWWVFPLGLTVILWKLCYP